MFKATGVVNVAVFWSWRLLSCQTVSFSSTNMHCMSAAVCGNVSILNSEYRFCSLYSVSLVLCGPKLEACLSISSLAVQKCTELAEKGRTF